MSNTFLTHDCVADTDDHVKSKNVSTEAKFGGGQLPLFLSDKLFLSLSPCNQQYLQSSFKIIEYPYVIGEEEIFKIIKEMYMDNTGSSRNSPPRYLKMQQCSILRGVDRSICKNSMEINIFYNGKNDLTLATVLAKLLQVFKFTFFLFKFIYFSFKYQYNVFFSIQRERCPTCEYQIHNHEYYYASGGKVTKICVKKLDPNSSLPNDDNIWFWSHDIELSSSTSRTIMSSDIGSLSFGRFLDKMFNIYSAKLLVFGYVYF